jgi:hypothetical protein
MMDLDFMKLKQLMVGKIISVILYNKKYDIKTQRKIINTQTRDEFEYRAHRFLSCVVIRPVLEHNPNSVASLFRVKVYQFLKLFSYAVP